MSELTPEERNAIINQIHGLVESLREDPHGIRIHGCREAVGLLLIAGCLALAGYVFLELSGPAQAVIGGALVGIAVVALIMYFFVRVMP